jgi:hypothetical protein
MKKLVWLLFPVLACGADWFEQQGARLERDSRGEIVTVDLTGVWVSDADLERLSGLPKLNRLVLAHTRLTDAGFANLAALKAYASWTATMPNFSPPTRWLISPDGNRSSALFCGARA